MKRRNSLYISSIVILLALNGYLFFFDQSVSKSSFDDTLFMITDTSLVQSIEIRRMDESITLKKTTQGWLLNDKYRVDEGFRNILLSIMNRIKVKRKVANLDSSDAGEVTFLKTDGTLLSFQFLSDPLGTRTFFIQNDESYQVEVPGYRENVVNIFELVEDQWRDRLVFDGSWRTIQKLSLVGANHKLNISFNGQFFELEGLNVIDSSAVVDYLNQFQLFQANEMVSEGRFPQLDSLRLTKPLATLSIEDIKRNEPFTFLIYPRLSEQRYHLVVNGQEEMMVFSTSRIGQILRSTAEFEGK